MWLYAKFIFLIPVKKKIMKNLELHFEALVMKIKYFMNF